MEVIIGATLLIGILVSIGIYLGLAMAIIWAASQFGFVVGANAYWGAVFVIAFILFLVSPKD